MKREIKQVFHGVSYSVQSAALAAETSGEAMAYAIGFARNMMRKGLAQCANTKEEEILIKNFVSSEKFDDKVAAGEFAAECLVEKWFNEE